MTHYVAIVEEEPGKAVGVWFPDLPGCFSGGDSIEEAMANGRGLLAGWADLLAEEGRSMPAPRTVSELKADPESAADIEGNMVALIPLEAPVRTAAE